MLFAYLIGPPVTDDRLASSYLPGLLLLGLEYFIDFIEVKFLWIPVALMVAALWVVSSDSVLSRALNRMIFEKCLQLPAHEDPEGDLAVFIVSKEGPPLSLDLTLATLR